MRPQRAIRGIGASDPPLYSCKKLERNLKSKEAEPTIFLVLTQILIDTVPPFHTHTRAYLCRYQSSPKKSVKSPQKVQKVHALRRAPGPGSVNADPCPDPGSKSGPMWPGSGSRVCIRPIMAWIRTPFFFLFDFSFSLMPLTIQKKGVEQKAKAKANAIWTFFLWHRCVLRCGCLFLSFIVKLAFFFPSFGQWQLIQTGPNVCCVPVLISGNAVRAGSSDEPRSRPRTDAIYLTRIRL